MRIERKSPRTGKWNAMDIPVTLEQIEAWENGELIQNAMPQLNETEREFIKTGFTPEDWDAIMEELGE